MTPLLTRKSINIAIAGNPNCGKTTLFNQLTGLRQKVGNYPGITVEKKTGKSAHHDHHDTDIHLIDLPGTYSLTPKSQDSLIAAKILRGNSDLADPVDAVFCVIDSNTLERSLPLVLQIKDLGLPMVVLLNMADEMAKLGMEIDGPELEKKLGVPVHAISARKKTGITDVKNWMAKWARDLNPEHLSPIPEDKGLIPIAPLRTQSKEIAKSVIKNLKSIHSFSEKVDKFVMHKVAGPIIFAAVVLVVFQSIFSWAAPFMDFIDKTFGSLASWVGSVLPEGFLNSLITDGIIAGVGSVIIFLPQILIVFFFIALLENSGYLARATIVMDRLFSKIGLQGKSFLPFVSSYACAIPGVMAARTIENRRERLATIFVAPFMTCSARLPVYALLIGAFVPNIPILGGLIGFQAMALLSLYVAGFLTAIITAWILHSSILKTEQVPFHLEVPPYRLPSIKSILLLMWDRSKVFLRRAGTIILMVNIILWFLASFPKSDGPEPVKDSYAGQLGVLIEPVIEPLGYNWKIGVGLIGSQAAREVIVSSLSTIYAIEDEEDEAGLRAALKQDISPLVALSLLIFFALAMQCMATTAVVKRETGGWKVPVLQFIYMNGLAYVAAFVVFQGGKLLGFQ